jgi:hypothetical protein
MSLRPARPSPGSVFWPFARELVKFVRELAINPRAPDLLNGHQADRLGWCSHPGHTPPERHPCSTLLWTAASSMIIALGARAVAEGVDVTGWHERSDPAAQPNTAGQEKACGCPKLGSPHAIC